mmetsp:Transcript_40127/g.96921  ORF Transcript_40127/g.96921 Transcript_40127/m.96921 type:complete len:203 (+) Transcript_40127:785-1393(+)
MIVASTPSTTRSSSQDRRPVSPSRWTSTSSSVPTVPTPVSPRPWMLDNTTSPSPSKSVSRSLMTRWRSTRRWQRCTSVTMSHLTSTDGSSPSTTTSVSELEQSSTVPPSSSTRRPSVTVPGTRSPEERSSRSKPTLSPNITVPAVSRAVWLLSVMLLDMLPSAPVRVFTSPPSLDVWLPKRLFSSWTVESAFPPKKRWRTHT